MNKVAKKIIGLLVGVFLITNQVKPMVTGLRYSWGLSERQGKRPEMEDTFSRSLMESIKSPGDRAFFAIYDGHGGRLASVYARENLHNRLSDYINEGLTVKESFIKAFEKTDEEIQGKVNDGTTAIAAYIDGNMLYLAWAGDSRAIVMRKGEVILATKDHKPGDPIELDRIIAAGAQVRRYVSPADLKEIKEKTDRRIHVVAAAMEGSYIDRVAFLQEYPGFSLSLSRSLGDKSYKNMRKNAVIATPDIISTPIEAGDIIILACDGIWDVLENKDAVQQIQETLTKGTVIKSTFDPEEKTENDGNEAAVERAAENLRDHAYNKKSSDNLSVLVIRIDQVPVGGGTPALVPVGGGIPAPIDQKNEIISLIKKLESKLQKELVNTAEKLSEQLKDIIKRFRKSNYTKSSVQTLIGDLDETARSIPKLNAEMIAEQIELIKKISPE
ncbi:MAG: PP2C family protein-serine/threonine phosphatase [bacterium]|nr:PP2C family protein-serine/threonine phosphatase [bacterium]